MQFAVRIGQRAPEVARPSAVPPGQSPALGVGPSENGLRLSPMSVRPAVSAPGVFDDPGSSTDEEYGDTPEDGEIGAYWKDMAQGIKATGEKIANDEPVTDL